MLFQALRQQKAELAETNKALMLEIENKNDIISRSTFVCILFIKIFIDFSFFSITVYYIFVSKYLFIVTSLFPLQLVEYE